MRTRLPNRRHAVNKRFDFKGQTFFLTMGYSEDLKVVEVFGNSARLSSDMDFLVADACIIISIALQHGISPEELDKSLKKSPNWVEGGEGPASLIGVIVAHIQLEQQIIDHIIAYSGGDDDGSDAAS